jgi:hypothetical protein
LDRDSLPQKGSPIVDEALLRIAALYKIEDTIRGADPDHRRAVRQELSRPLVDVFFAWHDVIGEPTFADAILDRIVHNAYRLELEGASMRKTIAKTDDETPQT